MMPRELQLEALESAPADLARVLRPLPPTALTWRPDPAEACILEVLVRIVHQEAALPALLYQVAQAQKPQCQAPSPLSQRAGASAAELLAHWAAARQALCAWLAEQEPGRWNRAVEHPELGRTTLRSEVRHVIERDTTHLNQILRLREAWEKSHYFSTPAG